jgi:hypothetical protein
MNATIIDALADLYISYNSVYIQVPSYAELETRVGVYVWTQIEKDHYTVASGVVREVTNIVWTHMNGDNLNVASITERLRCITVSNTTRKGFKILTKIKSGDGHIVTIRIPDFDYGNVGQADNLIHMFKFIGLMLKVDPSQIKVVKDESLGRDFTLPTAINSLTTNMMASVESASGDYPGAAFVFKGGFKANLVEILAAIRLLRRQGSRLKRRPRLRLRDGKFAESIVVNQDILKTTFNEKAGLKAAVASSYTGLLVRAVLAELTKVTNSDFPGRWVSTLKDTNDVTTNSGVLAKLGYVPIVADVHKLINVLNTKVIRTLDKTTVTNSVMAAYDFSKGEEYSYQEFRTAVCVSLPFIAPASQIEMQKQIIEPMKVDDINILRSFQRDSEIVDAINLAYAIKQAVLSKSNKTATVTHFYNAREHLLGLTANRSFYDNSGNSYQKYKDIPAHVRGFFEKQYHKKDSVAAADESYRKRKEGDMDIIQAPESSSILKKKIKKTPVSNKKRR